MQQKPTTCPICGEPLVMMYRVIERVAKNSRILGRVRRVKIYVPYYVCGTCAVAVRVIRISKHAATKLVARKPAETTRAATLR